MRGLTPNYHHSYTFFFFIVLVLFRHVFSTNTLSSTETLTISSNQTIVSLNDVFELGFFKTTTSSQDWYLGIWYKSSRSKITYVWIANRDNPLSGSIGTLKISDANNLILLNHSDTLIWSTNVTEATKSPVVVAELLDNGNFVLRDSKTNDPNRFLWQSFDFPVDTLLPEMKIGWDLKTGRHKFLRSWSGPYDPSSGDFSFKLETHELHEFHMRTKDGFIIYRTGPWNGIWFNGVPKMQDWTDNFIESKEEVAYTFEVTNQSIHSRLTLSSNGYLQWFSTVEETSMNWSLPKDICDIYMICGPNSYCDSNTSPFCKCIKGFEPKNVSAWDLGDTSSGCVRKSHCNNNGFVQFESMKLPETSGVIVDKAIGLKECKEKCFKGCNCTAFANSDIRNGGSGCVMWSGDLAGQDLYVKSSAHTVRYGSHILKIQEIGILYLVMQLYMWF